MREPHEEWIIVMEVERIIRAQPDPDVVVEERTGLLVDEHDVAAMADAMIRLIDDPSFAAQLGAAARDHVRANFSMDHSLDRLWAIVGARADEEGSRFENSPRFRRRGEHRAGCGLARADPRSSQQQRRQQSRMMPRASAC